MSACEKCWRDAHRSDDVAAEYTRLIAERKASPCTPEEQAGDDATVCPKCNRKAVHQHTGECMTSDCDYDEQRWKRPTAALAAGAGAGGGEEVDGG